MATPSIDQIQSALDDVLTSDEVADLPKTMTPSEDDFENEAEFLDAMENVAWCQKGVDFCIARLSHGWPERLRETFWTMAWQHIDFKKKYRLQYPRLYPDTIV
jgi:hypothetical protein